jgi:hypothetical protein
MRLLGETTKLSDICYDYSRAMNKLSLQCLTSSFGGDIILHALDTFVKTLLNHPINQYLCGSSSSIGSLIHAF